MSLKDKRTAKISPTINLPYLMLAVMVGLIVAIIISSPFYLIWITLNDVYVLEKKSNNESILKDSSPEKTNAYNQGKILIEDPSVQLSRSDSTVKAPTYQIDSIQKNNLYWQMSEKEKDEFIARRAQHIARMISNREYSFNKESLKLIKQYVDGYALRAKTRSTSLWAENLNSLYGRASKYAPKIISAFQARGISPAVGLYLAMIETEYHECLESPAGAKGMFQFMGATARAYGVDPNDRCDVAQMSVAAAHYMADRIAEFGTDPLSVTLAIAGYNRSPDSVRRDLQDVLNSENHERSFWSLVANSSKLDRAFQNENIKYVPKFFAAAVVGETPLVFGMELAPLSTYVGKLIQTPQWQSNHTEKSLNSVNELRNVELDRKLARILSQISDDSNPYIFPTDVINAIQEQAVYLKQSPKLQQLLYGFAQYKRDIRECAWRENIEPALLYYLAINEAYNKDLTGSPLKIVQQVVTDLSSLKKTFGNKTADSTLILIVAYQMGVGSKKSHPLLERMRRVINNPTVERNVWFLHKQRALEDKLYTYLINQLAIIIVDQS